MFFREYNGDIIALNDAYIIVNCVPVSLHKSSLTLYFLKYFPQMFKGIKSPKIGECFGYSDRQNRRSIINIVTKKTARSRFSYENLQKALYSLKSLCVSKNIRRIVFPMFHAVENDINYSRYVYLLRGVFHDTNIEVAVCFLDNPPTS